MSLPVLLIALLAILTAADATPQEPSASGATFTGTISGRVVSPYGELIADAVLTLIRTSDVTGSQSWTARTTTQGDFVFERLPPGRYSLEAAKQGFSGQGDSPPAGAEDGRIDLVEGQRLDGLEIVLRRSSSIAGRVIRPEGTPEAAAEVVVFLRDEGGGPRVLARTTAADDGRYEVNGLAPGEVFVGARYNPRSLIGRDTSDVDARSQLSVYPGVAEADARERVTVFEGMATEGIDIWLLPAPQRFSVSGRVFDPRGRPLRNIAVEHGDASGLRTGIWIVTDPDGYFTIEGVPPGTVVMLARAESSDGPLMALSSTEVSWGSVEDVRLALAAPGTVEGRLRFEGAAPTTVSGLRVRLVQSLLRVSPLFPAESAVVARDGRFRIPAALGEYEVQVEDLPEGWTLRRVERAGRPLPGDRVTVFNGERVSGVEIVLGR